MTVYLRGLRALPRRERAVGELSGAAEETRGHPRPHQGRESYQERPVAASPALRTSLPGVRRSLPRAHGRVEREFSRRPVGVK